MNAAARLPSLRVRRAAVAFGAGALAACALAGCDAPTERADAPRAQAKGDADTPLGAVVFLLDTVRRDHVSSYGYARPTTPAIDALARRGALFEQVVSYSSWTLPGVAAVLAGDYPPLVFDGDLRMQRSLVEAFAAAGFRTAAFTEGGYVSRRWGMDRGFDVFSEDPHTDAASREIDATFRAARDWLDANADAPFFLLIHTYEAHMPYTNRDFARALDPGRVGPTYELAFLERVRRGEIELLPAERDYIRALYDGDILSADRHVGAFVSFLEQRGLADRTLLVVTSDHGEEMGEEFPLYIGGHGHSLRDNLLLVPLVIFDPSRAFGGRRIATQVRTLDVLPTVAELLGAPVATPVNGRSLVPILAGAETADRTGMSGENNRGVPQVSIRDGRFKYIRAIDPKAGDGDVPAGLRVPAQQLYDLERDPAEDHNLVGENPKLARTLDRAVALWFNGLERAPIDASREDVDAKLRERLRALGYVD